MFSSRDNCRFINNENYEVAAEQLGTTSECPWSHIVSKEMANFYWSVSINTKMTKYDNPGQVGYAKPNRDGNILFVKYQEEYMGSLGIPDRHHDVGRRAGRRCRPAA